MISSQTRASGRYRLSSGHHGGGQLEKAARDERSGHQSGKRQILEGFRGGRCAASLSDVGLSADSLR